MPRARVSRPPRPLPLFEASLVETVRADSDADARRFATDPRRNVLLEASAGTGKTSVLVGRYLNLLRAGVHPANILAITFTRKAAAEMRDRIVQELRASAEQSALDRACWRAVRDHLDDIAIGTIDAFCLSLLREYPLEADLDPGFTMADETEVPRLMDQAIDRTLRIGRQIAQTDPDVKLVFARLGVFRLRAGLAHLIERRLVAPEVLDRYLGRGPADLSADLIFARVIDRLASLLDSRPGGLAAFLADGPRNHPRFQLLSRDLADLGRAAAGGPGAIRAALNRVRDCFLTRDGRPRKSITDYQQDQCVSPAAWRRHREAVTSLAPAVTDLLAGLERDLNILQARGIRRLFAVARVEYGRALEAHGAIDFPEVLTRALALLRQMDEFAQSRFWLESRYQHVLVDEFQDTSRAQWELVALLIQAWGEGSGVAHEAVLPPSIFVVGDRKQSIYRFRDAEVAVLEEAGRFIEGLRPDREARRSITRSFRAVPTLLSFANALFGEIAAREGATATDENDKGDLNDEAFRYDERDRFPVEDTADVRMSLPPDDPLGIVVAETPEECAARVADEIHRLLVNGQVRDRKNGLIRQAQPDDVAILFRSRETHQAYEHALRERGIPSYVYKGLGFFDADEVKDVCALMRFLADPTSALRTAAFLRSRFVRLSDRGLATIGKQLNEAVDPNQPPPLVHLDDEDRMMLELLRRDVARWIGLVDRIPPAEMIDRVIAESAYHFELRGPALRQGRENLKKIRGLIRRIQNRGYVTLERIAEYLERLSTGDESNALIDATGAVSLMTIHAAKGLEFPIVFLVNLGRGTAGLPEPIRLGEGPDGEPTVSVGPIDSEVEGGERLRDREETKRLLYVAVTRARDRLYLSSLVKDGGPRIARGSLADVMPESVRQLVADAARAAGADAEVFWRGRSGARFKFRVCGVPI